MHLLDLRACFRHTLKLPQCTWWEQVLDVMTLSTGCYKMTTWRVASITDRYKPVFCTPTINTQKHTLVLLPQLHVSVNTTCLSGSESTVWIKERSVTAVVQQCVCVCVSVCGWILLSYTLLWWTHILMCEMLVAGMVMCELMPHSHTSQSASHSLISRTLSGIIDREPRLTLNQTIYGLNKQLSIGKKSDRRGNMSRKFSITHISQSFCFNYT